MIRHLPNSITLLNLLTGCLAAVAILDYQYHTGFWLSVLCVFLDFADGLLARLLRVRSELGKQLDSLADMVAFGVVPGAIFYSLLAQPLAPLGFLVTVFAGLRLARFNLDTRQSSHFIGLPTPSTTLFSLGLLSLSDYPAFLPQWLLHHPAFLLPLIGVLSGLMHAELPLFSLKFSRPAWKGNEIKIIFIGISAALLLGLGPAALTLVIALYILLSIFTKPA